MSQTMSGGQLDGEWQATKHHCACGYQATWVLEEKGDELTFTEQRGSHCCGGVPNCFLKTHRMKKVEDGVWKGRLGFKPIEVKVVSDSELYHLTTNGPMKMVR